MYKIAPHYSLQSTWHKNKNDGLRNWTNNSHVHAAHFWGPFHKWWNLGPGSGTGIPSTNCVIAKAACWCQAKVLYYHSKGIFKLRREPVEFWGRAMCFSQWQMFFFAHFRKQIKKICDPAETKSYFKQTRRQIFLK